MSPQPSDLFPHNSPHPLDGQVFEAITTKDQAHLAALFSAGARVNAVHGKKGHTALSAAVEQGDRNLIQFLLDQGADVNGAGLHGETALMTAASLSRLELLQLLLEQGARIEAMSSDGDTALCLAAGSTAWVLVDEDPLEASSGITRQTPAGLEQLCPTDERQVMAVVEWLLEAGAQLNRGGCSATPLMEAARYGQLKLLKLLLQRGANPQLAAKDGQTALDVAKIYNQTRALTLLEAHQKASTQGIESEDDAKPTESAQLAAA